MHLDDFNRADPADAADIAMVWAAIPSWVDAIVAARPYGTVEDVARAAERAAEEWDANDLDAALAHHPRIGQRPVGLGAEAAASRREQAAMAGAPAELAREMARVNAAYEERFGRVFLIRAAGRSPEEMLAEARRRLANDKDSEASEAVGQLRQIALLRLRRSLSDDLAA
ncbi:MAG TPA: 2-oxo-4-hydroxy-4-carboxy-5-ureidoimidazoline decarboxylase [Arachnia sp.]|nr:2-oxo-4-hydroxy-4-carboxy-5-ureidoimidazoline decarboxylase [Arachnia sp.]HMT85266.1 2-oxo-4-hydroxy-4-carboxy-5-ureidoimidazoline decarboxylase [Arachnia sp.]